ncbi:hypothetical protein [Methylacidiphilum caldifontis]|uniref:hypothetical protein n=1 Tax=Methylacidiphilum caldifontis TaxID=2795386 RepID=UPI001F5C4E20|nr:hypothetical protein [Methylacidiphilum caldifontis]
MTIELPQMLGELLADQPGSDGLEVVDQSGGRGFWCQLQQDMDMIKHSGIVASMVVFP